MDEKKVFARQLNHYMKRNGKTQADLINDLGINRSTISTWCLGTKMPRMSSIQTLADYFGISKSDLIEERIPGALPVPKLRKVPLLGTIACGAPILAEENIEDYISIPEHIHADYCLRCKGDSMTGARILDGDLVYIRQQSEVSNGEIAAVLIDGEATLKRVYKYPSKLVLQPDNPTYEPMVYVGRELEQIQIIGKAVAFLSTTR